MRLMHRSKEHFYSITSSGWASSVGGTVRPSAFAVLRFMTSSNLVGCSIGRSAGLAHFRILPTKVAVASEEDDEARAVGHQATLVRELAKAIHGREAAA